MGEIFNCYKSLRAQTSEHGRFVLIKTCYVKITPLFSRDDVSF
jgi:hypothetical protein